MKAQLFILIFSILPGILFAAPGLEHGLFIKSYPCKASEMSSLLLEGGKPIELQNELTLTFDMYIRHENVFGNVFRIYTDKKENIDLIFTVGPDNKRYPTFLVNESNYLISDEIVNEQWIPVSITLSAKENLIRMKYGTNEQVVQYPFAKTNSVQIAFGLTDLGGNLLSNVASVNIKEVKLLRGEKTIRYWKLEKHNANTCYDDIEYAPAVALNPYWLIDDHITWSEIYNTKMNESPSIAYNPDTDDFYIVSNSKILTIFNAAGLTKKELQVKGGLFAANAPNQLLYIPQQDTLLSFNFDEDIFSFFSFASQTWSNSTPRTKEHSYWNNSISYNPADQSIVSFGGYGYYRYNNERVKKYPFGNGTTEKTQLTEIAPRYGLGATIVDNTLYILGGRGNKSGRQELFPKNYYDFYAVNLQTLQVNKLWELAEPLNGDFTLGENLIYDAERDCFYAFTMQGGGSLMKITKDTARYEPMSLPIDMDIEAQFMYTNLYYSPKQQKLFAVVNRTYVDQSAVLSIYSINYPPKAVSAMLQPEPAKPDTLNWGGFIIILVCSLAAIGGFVVVLFILRRKKKPLVVEKAEEKSTPQPKTPKTDFSKQSICFLGGFSVRDKNGEDITTLFTPTLKVLLILLVLFSEEQKRGILGTKMLQLMWEDKNESSARNNRNVYLSKLRTLLEQTGTIDIQSEGGFWSIKLGDVSCDYCQTMHYLRGLKEGQQYNEEEFDKLLELLLRGTLLPNTETDWIDRFKSNFSNLTIDTLSSLLTKGNSISNDMKLKIADTLFQHDFINEEALQAKCRILSESGKMGLAKVAYDNFCKEYSNLLGTEYGRTLGELLSVGVRS